ncbi:c-type cytochrome [Sphingomonas sp.]|uniref:c-type cytochrome n=1 Tax=Sphingomonas sp. TaxID=28214 RepID=UPI00286B0B60|nr:c-type cytochrome [Sphingomonas sp.]
MKRRASSLILAGAAGLFAISVAAAQTPTVPGPPPAPFAVSPYKNLKVFPKDVTRADLLGTMKQFSQSLGVRCTFCHVGVEGRPLATFDFASDAKPNKGIARDMLRLADRLNRTDLPAIGGLLDPHVTCYTCHRGSRKPATMPPAAPTAAPPVSPTAAPKAERG